MRQNISRLVTAAVREAGAAASSIEDTEDAVLAYRGSDFDKFVNERIAKQLERDCERISGTDIAAGAIAAAGGVGLMLLVGGAFIPFVSFAAMPLLRRRMLDSRLAAAKEDVLPALHETMEHCLAQMQAQFANYIRERAEAITQSAAASYTDALARLQDEKRRELEAHAQEQTIRQQECDALAHTLSHIEQTAAAWNLAPANPSCTYRKETSS